MSDYGQRRQMEDPTMVGTLAAQAEMIFPLERPLLEALGLPGAGKVLDLACGTGQLAGRVARAWPALRVVGLDLFEGHLSVARQENAGVRNLDFVQGDAHRTGLPDEEFGAVLLRHVLHALPERARVLREAQRLLRPGGLMYVLAEDYQGLLFDVPEPARSLFRDARPAMLPTGTDLDHGRQAYRDLKAAGFEDVLVHPLIVDTQNSSRQTFMRMLRFWRDGYAEFIASCMHVPTAEIVKRFDGLILSLLDSDRYACWLLFALSARRPA